MRVENTSGVAVGGLRQTLSIPSNFRYVMSVWGRGSGVTLTAGGASLFVALTGAWRRVSLPVDLGGSSESVTFGAVVAAGGYADLFGMQVEAQPGVSTYQKTGARGGVHSRARFDGGIFSVRAQGTDVYDAVVRIVSKGS